MDEPFDTKVAVVLLEDLAVWRKANAAAFLVSGIAGSTPQLVGEAYVDGSGNRYLPMLRQPILIYAADGAGVRRAYERAMAREVEQLSIFTRELFSTPHDTAIELRSPRCRQVSSTSSPSRYEPIARSSTKCSTSSDRTRKSVTDQRCAAGRRASAQGTVPHARAGESPRCDDSNDDLLTLAQSKSVSLPDGGGLDRKQNPGHSQSATRVF
jgi:hypothetical protein